MKQSIARTALLLLQSKPETKVSRLFVSNGRKSFLATEEQLCKHVRTRGLSFWRAWWQSDRVRKLAEKTDLERFSAVDKQYHRLSVFLVTEQNLISAAVLSLLCFFQLLAG